MLAALGEGPALVQYTQAFWPIPKHEIVVRPTDGSNYFVCKETPPAATFVNANQGLRQVQHTPVTELAITRSKWRPQPVPAHIRTERAWLRLSLIRAGELPTVPL
jgi:hypothetical protein